MKDDESQAKVAWLTKATKLGNHRSRDGRPVKRNMELECGSINFQETADAAVLAAPRPKKISPKNDLAEQMAWVCAASMMMS